MSPATRFVATESKAVEEYEQRQAAEHDQLVAEAEQAELEEEAQQQIAHRLHNAAVGAGLDPADTELMFSIYDTANGLMMEPEFRDQHRDEAEQLTAAFTRAAELAAPAGAGFEDEVQAAQRIMERRSAQRQIERHRARGGVEPLVDERRFEAFATMLGSSRDERAEARLELGMMEEE